MDHEAERELYARRIAARKMGLRTDFYGRNLPDELWKQCAKEAEQEIEADRAFRERNRIVV